MCSSVGMPFLTAPTISDAISVGESEVVTYGTSLRMLPISSVALALCSLVKMAFSTTL